MIRNKNQFLVSSEIYDIDTRQHANFHQPSVSLTKYQTGAYYLGVKVFNKLPTYIKIESDNPKKFNLVSKNFYMKIPFTLWMNILNFKKVKCIYICKFYCFTVHFDSQNLIHTNQCTSSYKDVLVF